MTCSAVIRDSLSAIARGRGHSLPTLETNDSLGCDSVSVNITWPDWLNRHTPPALITRNVRVEFMLRFFGKYAK